MRRYSGDRFEAVAPVGAEASLEPDGGPGGGEKGRQGLPGAAWPIFSTGLQERGRGPGVVLQHRYKHKQPIERAIEPSS